MAAQEHATPAPAQAEVERIGRALAAALPDGPSLRSPGRALDELLMGFAASDPSLRTALFRFLDVRPACNSRREVAEHLLALLHESEPQSRAGRLVVAATQARLLRPLSTTLASLGVRRMAHRFILADSAAAAARPIARMWREGVGASVDLVGEAAVSEAEADRYAARCARSLEQLAAGARRWPDRPALEQDAEGAVPRVNLSVKTTALTPQIRPEAPERGAEGALERLRSLLRLARDLGAHLHVDMESLDSRETVLGLVLGVLEEREFADGPSVGLVLQAYLRDSGAELDQILAWLGGSARSSPLTVRLVKGAYWDHEVIEARRHGWAVPVFERREESDRNFELLTRRLIAARPGLRLALASHNLRSIAHGIASLEAAGVPVAEAEFQVLRGLGDDLAGALTRTGRRVRVYCPVGEVVEGMAYLVRRMLENTANDSFLAAQSAGVALEELLAPPAAVG